MEIISYRNLRTVVDFLAVIGVGFASFMVGFIRQAGLGPMSIGLNLPVFLLILISYVHLVLRRGRNFDESEHSITYEIIKTFVFVSLVLTSYLISMSTEIIIMAGLTMSAIASMYVFVYRPHR